MPRIVESAEISDSAKWDIHLSYVVGYKQLSDNWYPARHHLEFGLIDFDFGKGDWPASICAQLLLSYSPVMPRLEKALGDFSGAYELNVGVRKVFKLRGRFQPHIAGGIGILGASTTTRLKDSGYSQEENRSALGYWGSLGAFWVVSESFFTGGMIEYSRGEITLFNQRLNPGGIHVLFNFGWQW